METSRPRFIFMAGLGGVSSAVILGAINNGRPLIRSSEFELRWIALFLVGLLLFITTQRYLLVTATRETQLIVRRLRLDVMDKVRQSELLALENISRAEITAAITTHASTLTQATTMLAFGMQGVVLVFLVIAYLAYLSLVTAIICIGTMSLAVVILWAKGQQSAASARETAKWENLLFDRLGDLLEGFKEVRLNRFRSEDLYVDISELAHRASNTKILSESQNFKRLVFWQSSVFFLLGLVSFLGPTVAGTSYLATSIGQSTTALVFVVGACFGLVQSIPVFAAANEAAEQIDKVRAKLGAIIEASVRVDLERKAFRTIEMRGIEFTHGDRSSATSFHLGPFDFTLRSGELVVIAGGNGSGKSTFLKILAGLYAPQAGTFVIDGTPLDGASRESYRALITSVFTDYHLFQKLYGIRESHMKELDTLLSDFGLSQKTGVVDGITLRTIDLSGGQRKRLALVVGLLEGRPILLLDEWTADQDPEFRRKFYSEILPALVEQGITIVLVTHDDRFAKDLRIPARKLRMEDGRFVAEDVVDTLTESANEPRQWQE
jgi:putative ATP-binding cassette transporter